MDYHCKIEDFSLPFFPTKLLILSKEKSFANYLSWTSN